MGPGSLDECLGCMYEESEDIRVHMEYCSGCCRAYYDPDLRNLYDDKFTPQFNSIRFDRREPVYDCNDCIWLNITVEQKERLYKETRRDLPHICQYYDKRIVHQGKGKEGELYLYPCTSCRRDNFRNYEECGLPYKKRQREELPFA